MSLLNKKQNQKKIAFFVKNVIVKKNVYFIIQTRIFNVLIMFLWSTILIFSYLNFTKSYSKIS